MLLVLLPVLSFSQNTVSVIAAFDSTYSLTIPNTFTPNGDAINDGFTLDLSGATEVTAQVYNRYGTLVKKFSNSNLATSDGSPVTVWDGYTTSGEQCSEGVYFYVVQALDLSGQIHEENGTVHLF